MQNYIKNLFTHTCAECLRAPAPWYSAWCEYCESRMVRVNGKWMVTLFATGEMEDKYNHD